MGPGFKKLGKDRLTIIEERIKVSITKSRFFCEGDYQSGNKQIGVLQGSE